MTPDQKDLIVSMFQLGMACGLDHPFEFFSNYIRSLSSTFDYKKVPELERKAYEAMIEFLKGTAGCDEEQDFLNNLDTIKLNQYISGWYRGHQKRMQKWCEENLES